MPYTFYSSIALVCSRNCNKANQVQELYEQWHFKVYWPSLILSSGSKFILQEVVAKFNVPH